MTLRRGALCSRLEILATCCLSIALGACGGGSSSTPSPGPTGSGTPTLTSFTKTAIAAYFVYPSGVAVDGNGNVFIADYLTNQLKEIPFSGGTYGIPIVVDSGLSKPGQVALDASGDLFVADYGNATVKEFTFSGGRYSPPVSLGKLLIIA